jgi:hypothetical protein
MAKKCNPMCLSLSKIESIYIKPIVDAEKLLIYEK